MGLMVARPRGLECVWQRSRCLSRPTTTIMTVLHMMDTQGLSCRVWHRFLRGNLRLAQLTAQKGQQAVCPRCPSAISRAAMLACRCIGHREM